MLKMCVLLRGSQSCPVCSASEVVHTAIDTHATTYTHRLGGSVGDWDGRRARPGSG